MNTQIPAHVLVERLDFVLQSAYLHANAAGETVTGKEISEARDLVSQLRGAIA